MTDGKRRFIVDTDTGSDDVWAVMAALRAPHVTVEAVTTVCGNLPLELCARNALLAAQAAGGAQPPVFAGCEKPLKNERPFYAFDCHGPDGLSGMDLPDPHRRPEAEHAVDALVRLVKAAPGQLEIVTCGPLTNIASACLKDGDFARSVKRMYILGGAARGRGNMTEAAEYNVFVDPDAAQTVLDSGMDTVWVCWDCACGGAAFSDGELEALARSESPAARFCERCIRQMKDYYKKEHGEEGLAVIDSVLMTAALHPEIMTELYPAFCRVNTHPGGRYGEFIIDKNSPAPNARVCAAVDAAAYKQHLLALLGV